MLSSNGSLKLFDDFFTKKLKPSIINQYCGEAIAIRNVIDRFEQMIDYNVPHGKKLRGMCVYESLVNLLDLNEDQVEHDIILDQARAIGWCIEFLQASFLVADDIMDNSTYRRGQICWYRKALTNTVIGQGLDLITPPAKSIEDGCEHLFDFTNYTQENYDAIVKWKTAFYSFCLPVQSALYLASIDNAIVHEKCKNVLIKTGNYFQVQDDFLDCYGDPKITGKVGTDIEESKCSWLVIQALRICNKDQRVQLEKFYGKSDQASVKIIKDLFNQLNLKDEYEKYEKEKYDEIKNEIQNLSFNEAGLSEKTETKIKLLLNNYANKIFKRNK